MKVEQQDHAHEGDRLDTGLILADAILQKHSRMEARDPALELCKSMDGRMDNEKLNLTHEQLESVKKIEQAVVKGDNTTVQKIMASFGQNPAAADSVMQTVCKDLNQIGVKADWSHESVQAGSSRQIGRLHMQSEVKDANGSAVMSVDYRTSGQSHGEISRTSNGQKEPDYTYDVEPPSALRSIVNQRKPGQ